MQADNPLSQKMLTMDVMAVERMNWLALSYHPRECLLLRCFSRELLCPVLS